MRLPRYRNCVLDCCTVLYVAVKPAMVSGSPIIAPEAFGKAVNTWFTDSNLSRNRCAEVYESSIARCSMTTSAVTMPICSLPSMFSLMLNFIFFAMNSHFFCDIIAVNSYLCPYQKKHHYL